MSVKTLEDYAEYKKWKEDSRSEKKVLYYTALWCPPCKKIGPLYEKLSGQYEAVSFAKVDVDKVDAAAQEQRIRSVPTFQFFKGDAKIMEVRAHTTRHVRVYTCGRVCIHVHRLCMYACGDT
jgi:thioredoxin 1